jgi:CheY-like chemotaxis protein
VGQQASIFLVEDEAIIRMMLAEMVEELGHRVVAEAGSIAAAEPLAQIAAFDLAILDINVGGHLIMPVAEILDSRHLPFFFLTGYTKPALPEQFGGRKILLKPFLIDKLRDTINSILANS